MADEYISQITLPTNIIYELRDDGALRKPSSITDGYVFAADSTDGLTKQIQATNANTASTIVYRDANKNFSAGTITATLNGSAYSQSYTYSTLDITKDNLGITANVDRAFCWIGEKNGNGLGRLHFIAKTDGKKTVSLQVRPSTLNSSNERVAGSFQGISITGNLDNTISYTVSNPDNFLSAINAIKNEPLITLTKANHTGDHGLILNNTESGKVLKLGYIIGSSANGGIYDYTHSSWKVKIATDGTTTFTGNLTGNADTATKVKITSTSLPSSGSQTSYLTFSSSTTTGNQDLKNADRLYIYENTSAIYLNIGKSTIMGGLTLHSATNASAHGDLVPTTLTASTTRTWRLPNASGWVVIGGNGTTTGAGDTDTPIYLKTDGTLAAITSYDGNAASATKIAAKLATTTKTFLLGTSTTITGTAANVALIGDTGVYLTTTAGQLSAKSYSVNDGTNEKVRMEWNATDQSLDFVFA